MYKLLNEPDENDYGYMQMVTKRTIQETYNKYKDHNHTTMIRDGLLEHSFERVVLSACNRYYIARPIINIIITDHKLIPHILQQDYININIICSEHTNQQDYGDKVKYVRDNSLQDMIKHVSFGWLLFLEGGYRYNNSNALTNISSYLYNSSNIIKIHILPNMPLCYTNIIIHNVNKWEALYIENIKRPFIESNNNYIVKIY